MNESARRAAEHMVRHARPHVNMRTYAQSYNNNATYTLEHVYIKQRYIPHSMRVHVHNKSTASTYGCT